MGSLGVLKYITAGCDALTTHVSPSLSDMGLHMLLELAALMMLWFGLQEVFASARGGAGFDIGAFFNFSILVVFAYTFVKYSNSDIPGLSFSFLGFIRDGTNSVVDMIGIDTTNDMLVSIGNSLSKSGVLLAAVKAPYLLVEFILAQILLATLSASVLIILAYGALGAAVVGLLGPLFIPWMVFNRTEWLFTGWLKAYLGFEFYKVVGAAVMNILAKVYIGYATTLVDWAHPIDTLKNLPLLVTLVFVCASLVFKIPALTATLFSGSTSGHDGSNGVMASAATALRTAIAFA